MFLLFLFFHFLCLPNRRLVNNKKLHWKLNSNFFNFSIFSLSVLGPFLITASFEHHFFHPTLVHSITLYSHSFLIIPCTTQMLSTCWLICMMYQRWLNIIWIMRRAFGVSRLHSTNSHSKLTMLRKYFSSRTRSWCSNGEPSETSPRFSCFRAIWGENFLLRRIFAEENHFLSAAGAFLVIVRMIHAYCDLFYLIDFNWLLLVTQTFPSDCIENSSSWFQLIRFPGKKKKMYDDTKCLRNFSALRQFAGANSQLGFYIFRIIIESDLFV